MKIRVAILATGAISRSGLAATLASSAEIAVVGTAKDLAETITVVDRTLPDVILMDLGNLLSTSLWESALFQQLQERSIPLVIIDRFERLDLAGAVRAGVRGMLTDTSTEMALVAAVSAVAVGLTVFEPQTIDLCLRDSIASSERDPSDTHLTPREIEVLVRLGSGLGNKAIARGLQISEHTVKFHISSIFQKLAVSTRTEAVAVGIRRGLILL